MWEDHPTIDDFQALFRRAAPLQAARAAGAVQHFLTGCSFCRSRLREAGWDERRIDRLFWLSAEEIRRAADTEPPWQGHDYGHVFAAAERSLIAFFGQDTPLATPAEALVTELLALPESEQLRQAAENLHFSHPEVVRGLITHSHQVRYNDPRRMLHLAELARDIAEACTIETTGNQLRLADLRARGWMQYGNALRACGQIPEADDALAVAQKYRDAGTRDPLLRARLFEHLTSLRTSQGKFQLAIELADRAGAIYRELGEHHNLASTMVQKAIALIQLVETEEATRFLNRAISKLNAKEHPDLLLAACLNLIHCYIDLDRPDQALSLYLESRDLFKELADSTILLRTGWQEGRMLRDLGQLGAAEKSLWEARQGFLERGLVVDVAHVSLDLAWVYVRTGKVEELERTVSEALPIFSALRAEKEIIKLLLQLRQAAGQEQKALELIRSLNLWLAPLAENPPSK